MRIYPRRSVDLNRKAIDALLITLNRGELIRGGNKKVFEEEFSKYIGVKKSWGIGSARTGLYLALRSFGFKEADEVIMPAYTFYALPLIVKMCELKPVFIDSNHDTYNIDVSLIRKSINKKTKAIIISHLFGQPAEMDVVMDIAREYNLKVIEDCAHSLGAEYRGRKVGSFGDLGIFSFGIGKNNPCFGGGMMTANNDALIERINLLCEGLAFPDHAAVLKNVLVTFFIYVMTKKTFFPYLLYPALRLFDFLDYDLFDHIIEKNSNGLYIADFIKRVVQLSNLQAAVGLAQLQTLERMNNLRIKNAQLLSSCLKQSNYLALPEVIPDAKHIFLYFCIRVKRRRIFRKRLLSRGIDTKKDDISVCPNLEIFKEHKAECSVAARLSSESLEIPNSPYFNEEDVRHIARQVLAVAEQLSR